MNRAYRPVGCRRISALILMLLAGSLYSSVFAQQGNAEQVWVTDEFEVTMRNGQGNREKIIRMLGSGTRLERVEKNDETGYSLVRTGAGTEGWVLNRYLLRNPPPRVTMPDMQAKLTRSEAERKKLTSQLREVTAERSQLQRKLADSGSSADDLQTELARISGLSANAVQLDGDNMELRKMLKDTQTRLEQLQVEADRLASRSNREWFVIGALVVMFGILVGLIVPRIRWRRKSSWGEL